MVTQIRSVDSGPVSGNGAAPYSANAKACGDVQLANIPYEPLLQLDEIQGNVLGGFNKDHQALVYLQLHEDLQPFRDWLARNAERVATAGEVVQFNRLFKEMRKRRRGAHGRPSGLQVTWFNISFSHRALARLTEGHQGDLARHPFADQAFTAGMAARAISVLGDPRDEQREGNPRGWVVGREDEIDVLVLVAADTRESLRRETKHLHDELELVAHVLKVDEGVNDLEHASHFGFRDAISQPGVRGLCSAYPDDFLTPRQNPADPNDGLPGQKLVWPGEFVLGYADETLAAQRMQGQNVPELDIPAVPDTVGPDWAANGSFLVLRRLRQHVAEFEAQVKAAATNLGVHENVVKARMLGRWPNGAPLGGELLNEPPGPEPAQARGIDPCTNNAFGFQNQLAAQVCPAGAHIRKAYPRDDEPNEERRHRILRRGISYANEEGGEKGLLFLAYQASIPDQFEHIVARMNDPRSPVEDSGYDLLAGQSPSDEGRRYLVMPDYKGAIESEKPFVTATGGGYFFTPSISALRKLAEPAGSWTPQVTDQMKEDRVKYAYYALGRFVYEQAPYATGPNLQLTADFYHTANSGDLAIQTDGLAQDYGIHPLDDKPQRLFSRSSNQLTDNDQLRCLWWYFRGNVQRVTKAIRIPYRYRRGTQMNEVAAALLIGFAGPGHE